MQKPLKLHLHFRYVVVVTGVFTQIFMTNFAKVNDSLKVKEETTFDLCGLTLESLMSLKLHLLTILESSFTIVTCLEYRPQETFWSKKSESDEL